MSDVKTPVHPFKDDVGKNLYRKKTYYTVCIEQDVLAKDKDEADRLPSEKCLLALAELRHARWFSAMASNLPSCVECIRIMRDLCRREPSWSCLTDWSIELIVERALFSAWRPLNPAASLMRVMEVRNALLAF